jgi:FkbM family methyltransferase
MEKGGIFDAFARKDYNFLNVTNKTVINIGMSIRDIAIYIILGGARCVVAFEPFLKIFYIAQKNIIENNMEDKITLVNAGFGFDGYVSIDENFGSDATSRLVDHKQGLQIPVYSLDTIISKFNVDKDSILKVDCEGCEYELFKNAPDNSLLKFIRIQIEYHYGFRIL